ncbi:MAG: winged-helix domain-containing protein [Microbacteriaceae bacterium]|nr:winged-helix domain-containing protein [Microbacteriaceae bacterium]
MQLLCLTDIDPSEMLPGLDVLPHEIRSSPLKVRLTEGVTERFDLIIIDALTDVRGARTACLELAAQCSTPRLLVCTESSCAAVTAQWQISDVMLPAASPAEIDMRLRLAVGATAHEEAPASRQSGAVSVAGVTIDEGNFTARVQGRALDLTYKEFELLHFLLGHPDRVFTRDQLLSEVWGTDYYGGTRTVDVHIRRLRAKLGDHEGLISTVRGVGYGFARDRQEGDDDDE